MTSHEMRNPLSAILQCADEISGSLIEFKANPGGYTMPSKLIENNIDAAQTIALCANHQTRIVSDVLTLSKLDSQLLSITPVVIEPDVPVESVLTMLTVMTEPFPPARIQRDLRRRQRNLARCVG